MSTAAEVFRRIGKLTIEKSPTILSAVGIVGAVTTAYLAGKASFQAAELIHAKEAQDEADGIVLNDRERTKERVQLVWRLYIPAVTAGGATLASILGAHRISSRRAAGLALASGLSAKAFDEYKGKVAERLGAGKEQTIRDELTQELVDRTFDPEADIYGLVGDELCVLKYSAHYFRSTADKIHKAVNDFNYMLNRQEHCTLADLYDFLGIRDIPAFAEQVGWDINWGLLEVSISGATTMTMKPCLGVEFKSEPRPVGNRFL